MNFQMPIQITFPREMFPAQIARPLLLGHVVSLVFVQVTVVLETLSAKTALEETIVIMVFEVNEQSRFPAEHSRANVAPPIVAFLVPENIFVVRELVVSSVELKRLLTVPFFVDFQITFQVILFRRLFLVQLAILAVRPDMLFQHATLRVRFPADVAPERFPDVYSVYFRVLNEIAFIAERTSALVALERLDTGVRPFVSRQSPFREAIFRAEFTNVRFLFNVVIQRDTSFLTLRMVNVSRFSRFPVSRFFRFSVCRSFCFPLLSVFCSL